MLASHHAAKGEAHRKRIPRWFGWAACGAALALGSISGAAADAATRAEHRAAADALFTNSTVLRLRLRLSKEAMDSLRKEPRKYVEATLREGDTVYEKVGVHLKGSAGSFRPVDDKPGLTLNLTTLGGTNRFHGLKKFHLNNSVQDPTYLSEYVCGEMFRQAGVPAARAALAVVELNGRRLGLMVLLESMNKDFLARYFQQTKGNLYGQPGGCEITDAIARMEGEGPLDRADLKALAAAAREPDPARRWERLQTTLDVDRFLAFMGLEVLLCHWDGYTLARHNYRVYQDLDTGRMVFIPHDLDQMMQNPNAPVLNPGVNGLVAQAIWKLPPARFRERLTALYTNVFVVPALTARIDQRVAQVLPALTAYDPNLAQQFKNNAESLKSRIVNRGRVLAKQLEPAKPLKFENQIAKLSGWRKEMTRGSTSLAEVKSGAIRALYIKCGTGGGLASWRTTVLLEPGRYRFSGQARCAAVTPMEGGAGGGGGVRNSLSHRSNKLVGTVDWTPIAQEFDVPPDKREVVLVCELRAQQGEIWFNADSLMLERLK